jgi:23S rRNA (cytosine1962-C5)-methyltransferase
MGINDIVQLKLKSGQDQRLLNGHRWVFSNELAELPKEAKPGSLALLNNSRGRLLGMGFFHPGSLIAFRLLSRDPGAVDAAFFRSRLEDARDYREQIVGDSKYYRLCAAEADGLPGLVIDRYGDHFVLEVSTAGIEVRLPALIEALKAVFAPKSIFAHNDMPVRALEGLAQKDEVLLGDTPKDLGVVEDGQRYFCAPRAGLPFPFAQRENRELFKTMFQHKSVLDMYCGIGTFGILAAKGGAARVYGVDSSPDAIALAKRSLEKSGAKGECKFEAANPEDALGVYAGAKGGLAPDLVFLSPPNLAVSKRHVGRALRAYLRINTLGFRALKRGGMLATTVPSAHITGEAFVDMLRSAAAKAGKTIRLRHLRGQAQDHPVLLAMPETRSLSFALLEVV